MNSENTNKFGPAFFGIVFLIIIYLLWLMTKQMLEPILFGLILGGIFYPFNTSIKKKLGLSDTKAAGLTSFVIIAVLLVPLTFLVLGISKEAVGLYQKIVAGLDQKEVSDFLFGEGLVASAVKQLASLFNIDLNLELIKSKLLQFTQAVSSQFLAVVNNLVGDVFGFIFNLILMVIVVFGLMVEGDRLKQYVFDLSPLPTHQEEIFLSKFNQMNYVTLVCNGVGGVLQGVLGGIALWIAGVDSILLWTLVMIFLAFIPLVGISLVTVPASLFFILTGEVFKGVTLFVFSAAVGIVVENWFKPKFIGERIQINSTFVLLSIIGGMGAFGVGGIFYGPIIGILFLTIVEMYHDQYSDGGENSNPTPAGESAQNAELAGKT